MATYTLTDGTRKTKLTINGDTTVVFPTKLDYFGVRSLDGADILVSKIKAPTALEDGVYSTDEGDGDVVVDDGIFTDTLYLKGSGTVVVYGGAKPNHLPFKVGGKGGVRCLGTTTTELYDGSTANPIVIDGVSVTAKRNDIAFYGASEYMFNGTAWSAFGDLSGLGDLAYLDKSDIFDNTPTSGSSNGVTSDGVWRYTPLIRAGVNSSSAVGGYSSQALYSAYAIAFGSFVNASGNASAAFGHKTHASEANMTAIGKYNSPRTGDLFNIGNGTAENDRSNIVEVNSTSMNVNGDIKKNGTAIAALAFKSSATGTALTSAGTLPSLTYDSLTERFTFNAGTLPTSGTVTVS